MGKAKSGNSGVGGGVSVASLAADNAALKENLQVLTALIKDLRAELFALKGGAPPPSQSTVSSSKTDLPPPTVPSPQGHKTPKGKKGDDISEGWTPVGKSRSAKPTSGDTLGSRPALRLRLDDWSVPVLDPKELREGKEGVALVPNDIGESIFNDLAGSTGQLAIITLKPIEGAGESCRSFQCKVLTAEDRFLVVKRWLTDIGSHKVKPNYERSSDTSGAPITLVNNTERL